MIRYQLAIVVIRASRGGSGNLIDKRTEFERLYELLKPTTEQLDLRVSILHVPARTLRRNSLPVRRPFLHQSAHLHPTMHVYNSRGHRDVEHVTNI